MMRYLITGGGTGGHIYPALAIADEIKSNEKDAEILYVGTKEGLEAELVPKAGFRFKTIRVKGMPRKINKDFFIAIKELLLGINDSRKVINKFQPDVVIGTGGYVCGPVVYMAKKKKIPAMIHEQNAFPGITNKILSRYVDKVAVTFEKSKEYFKYPERVVVTGNPIRREILEIDKDEAYEKLNIDRSIPLILSFGGSGGQKKLNDEIYRVVKKANQSKNLQLIHVTGKRHYNDFVKKLEKEDIILNKNIRIFEYLHEMPYALNIATLVIASAGAITLAEISAVGAASILIPKSYTAENHQEYNAREFEKNGASILILEKDLKEDSLWSTIYDIIYDRDKLDIMKKRSKSLGKTEAANKIFKVIKSIVNK